jgi:2-polyprenyl-3-methyl-5-hydroxy-6-metoxy-1,4-benzoquinol methylase
MDQSNQRIAEITKTLTFTDGIWYSQTNNPISYPLTGNDQYFTLEDRSYWFLHRNKILIHFINMFSKGKEFFDIGGGNGFVSKALIEAGYNSYLVEPGFNGIVNGKKRGIKNLIYASFEEANFIENSLDNVGLFDVLEHIESDCSFLIKLHSSMKTGGRLFISVPAYSLLWSKSDDLADHFRRYTKASLKKVLLKSGFKVITANYFFSFLIPVIFLFRTLPSLFYFSTREASPVNESEHLAGTNKTGKILEKLCQMEMQRINRGKRIFMGSSCLMVAEKEYCLSPSSKNAVDQTLTNAF